MCEKVLNCIFLLLPYNFGHMPPLRRLDVLQRVGALTLDMEGGARNGSQEGRHPPCVAAGGLDGALVARSLPGSGRPRRHRRRVLARVVAGAEPNAGTVVGTTATSVTEASAASTTAPAAAPAAASESGGERAGGAGPGGVAAAAARGDAPAARDAAALPSRRGRLLLDAVLVALVHVGGEERRLALEPPPRHLVEGFVLQRLRHVLRVGDGAAGGSRAALAAGA